MDALIGDSFRTLCRSFSSPARQSVPLVAAGSRGRVACQDIQDGAVRPLIAMAAVHKMLERCLHGQQLLGLLLQRLDVDFGQRLDEPARALAVVPQAQQLANLVDGEAQITRLADEAQRMDFAVVVLAVP
jgi:hypothetical protein